MLSEIPVDRWEGFDGLQFVGQAYPTHALLDSSPAAKPSITSSFTQTDENITKIKCPPLKLLQPASSISKQNKIASIPTVSTSSASNQAHPLPSTSTISESQPTIPTFNTNDPLYLVDQAIVKKSRKRLLPKYNETGTSFLQISKSNIPTKFAAIAVKKFSPKTTFNNP
ncbi:hypothetical protein TNCV_2906421 [Trichonephila clavipes]|nr:hypothetical protein TNCV_2906421 [Trichonephila clavipes]